MNRLFVILLTLLALGCPAGATSTILCTFTGADGTTIQTYTDSGTEMAFTRNTAAGAANNAVIAANRIRANNTSGSFDYVNNWTPSGSTAADYWMQGEVTLKSIPNSNTHQVGIGVRAGTTTTQGYYFLMESRTGSASIRFAVYRAGNATPLGTPLTIAASANDVYQMRIAVIGGSTPTIYAGYSNITAGTSDIHYTMLAPITPAGADIITATGVAATYIVGVAGAISDSTGFHMDNLKANDVLTLVTPSSGITWDNGHTGTASSGVPKWSSFSSIHLQTDASAITVVGTSATFSLYPAISALGYRIDGIQQPALIFAANNTSTAFGLINSGTTSIYEILHGGASNPSGTILENTITGIVVYGYTTLTQLTQPTALPRLLELADSVGVGANATVNRAWVMQLRYGGPPVSVMVEGWGGKAFWDDAVDATARTNTVSYLGGLSPTITTLYFEYTGNDFYFGGGRWSAASYRTAMDDFLDKFHVALPNAVVYLQTSLPFVSPASEGANSFGSTLGDYRTQMAASGAARPTFCRVIDGTGTLLTGSPAVYDIDGIHFLAAGHDQLYHNIRTALGFKTVVIGTSSTNFNPAKTTVFRP